MDFLAWMLRHVFYLSLFSHFTFLHFLSLNIFVCLSRGIILLFHEDRLYFYFPNHKRPLTLDVF